MTLPTLESLRELSRDELIALVLQLAERLERLEGEVERLKHPPPTSRNSSQPPSRDQKPNAPPRKRRRHRGAKTGHAKADRPLTDTPNQTIEARPSACTRCGQDLQTVAPARTVRRQITELPDIKPVVIETRQLEVTCPACGHAERGRLPLGLEAERQFGPRLEATITYLQHQQHLSYERTQTTLADVFGVVLSEGGQACVIERAGQAAQVQADAWRADLRQSAVVGSDETGARVDGRNWWEWVFVTATAVLHVIRPSRAVDVIEEMMGPARAGTWVCDCWKPQLRAPADRFQLCLAHQIRNLQGLLERAPRLRWARELQALFREAIHLAKRRAQLSARGFARRVTYVERRLDRLLARPVTTPAAQALVKRYRKHRAHLLVFLHDPAVPHHNNTAERALRPSVIHRKVTGGFRSAWGAHAYGLCRARQCDRYGQVARPFRLRYARRVDGSSGLALSHGPKPVSSYSRRDQGREQDRAGELPAAGAALRPVQPQHHPADPAGPRQGRSDHREWRARPAPAQGGGSQAEDDHGQGQEVSGVLPHRRDVSLRSGHVASVFFLLAGGAGLLETQRLPAGRIEHPQRLAGARHV